MMVSSKTIHSFLMVLAVSVVGGAVYYHKVLRWKRFHVVEENVLYRSGILRDWQLERAIDQYAFRTVVSFTHTNNASEQQVCAAKGIDHHLVYLHGNGQGPRDQYLRFLQLVQEPANHPMLIHCSAGVQRTGGAAALYRVLFQQWRFDDAVSEMIALGNKGRPEQIAQLRRVVEALHASAPTLASDLRRTWR